MATPAPSQESVTRGWWVEPPPTSTPIFFLPLKWMSRFVVVLRVFDFCVIRRSLERNDLYVREC